ncbi:MAG: GNAT family N-acetyltransferase [Anaerolineales bacterium]
MSTFSIRHYIPEQDLHNLHLMLTEIESIDHDGEDTSEEYLLGSLQWPNYRPAQDVWVAEADGKLVGYGVALEQPSQRCTIYVVVHPSQRRQGLGSQLLDLTLNRAREFGSQNILVYANDNNQASNLFLKHHGLQAVGSSGALKAPATINVPAPEFPVEFALKQYSEVNEPRTLLNALNMCYFGMWGHGYNPTPSDEDIKFPRFLHYYKPEDILLLYNEKKEVIGICSLKSEGKKEGNGEVSDLLDGPGILQEYRDKGYQRQMVLAGIQHLRQRHTHPITLEFWGESESALNSYRELGFEMVTHYIAYHKELT